MIWKLTLGQAARHIVAYLGSVLTIIGLMWGIAKPRAEDFVKDTIAQEKFVTHEELEKQSQQLKDLAETVEKQSRAIDGQNQQMGIMSNDLGTVKSMQRDTLRAILKLKPDDQ